MSRPLDVFCSYAHEDEALRDQLATHLASLERGGLIRPWHDRKITGGEEWAQKIDRHLRSADIVLLLISSSFMASDYCWDLEMMRALERHEARTARVVPIILRPVDWESAPFSKLLALPKDGKPITQWPNLDEAFLDVVQGLRTVVEELRTAPPVGRSKPSPSPPTLAQSEFQGCLVYSQDDEDQVEVVARWLRKRGVRIWFQKWDVMPGQRAEEAFERSLLRSETTAIFVGPSGMAPWQNAQYFAVLRRAIEENRRLIPVLMPGTGSGHQLPPFLATYSWVQLKSLDDLEALGRLQWGITGVRPPHLG